MTEQEQIELYKQADLGRDAKITLNFIDRFLLGSRARIIRELETMPDYTQNDELVADLRALRRLENNLKTYIQKGEIAEERVNNGSN